MTQPRKNLRLAPPSQGKLIMVRGPYPGRTFRLEPGRIGIGRSTSNEICLDDNSVSRNHCSLVSDAHGWWLKDLETTNGTWIDGKRVYQAQLRPGDKVRVGNTCLFLYTSLDAHESRDEHKMQLQVASAVAKGVAAELEPLTVMLQAMVSQGMNDPSGHMQQATRSAQALRARLIDVAGLMMAQGEVADASQITEEVVREISQGLPVDIELDKDVQPDVFVAGDLRAVKAAFLGICDSAVATLSSSGGGQMRIELGLVQLQRVGQTEPEHMVALEVMFTSPSTSISRSRWYTDQVSKGGPALGLAAAYRIIASQDGEVYVEGDSDKTRVTVLLEALVDEDDDDDDEELFDDPTDVAAVFKQKEPKG